jgi:hypothetical protein
MEQFGMDLGPIAVTAVSLLVFGYFYNRLVDWLHRHGYNDGYVWLEVVVGTAVILLAAGFTIGWANVLILFIYFAAGGLFMALGDMLRYARARRLETADDNAETMAQ